MRDNGIGMSYDEVGQLIGTIANSGTTTFLQELKEAKDAAGAEGLIGQFGVGFYSGFMAADEVTLVSRRAGESQGTRWTSRGEATYTLEKVDDAPQGTSVTLHLKPADPENQLHDYTSPWRISRKSSSGTRTSSPGRSGWSRRRATATARPEPRR
ncbi:Chaperone protein HtpG [Streptomyces purpurascens]